MNKILIGRPTIPNPGVAVIGKPDGLDLASFDFLPSSSKTKEHDLKVNNSVSVAASSPSGPIQSSNFKLSTEVELSKLSFSAPRPATFQRQIRLNCRFAVPESLLGLSPMVTNSDLNWAAAKFIQTKRVQQEQRAQSIKQIVNNLRAPRLGVIGKVRNCNERAYFSGQARNLDSRAGRDGWIEIEADRIERLAEVGEAPPAVHVGFAELDLFDPFYLKERDALHTQVQSPPSFISKVTPDPRPALNLMTNLWVGVVRAQEAIAALVGLTGANSEIKR